MSVEVINGHRVIVPTIGSGGQLIGVGVHEVSRVIGRASLVVNELCSARDYINRWAKYKPVRWPHLNTLPQWDSVSRRWIESGGDISQNGKWWQGVLSTGVEYISGTGNQSGYVLSTSCGITVRGFWGELRYLVDKWDSDGWQHFWEYSCPRGDAVVPAEPFRLTDFALYDHDADKPLRNFTAPSEIIKYTYGASSGQTSQTEIAGNAEISWPAGGTDYQLTLDDLNVKVGAAQNDTLKTYYFGVVVTKVRENDGTPITGGNRTFGIISAEKAWNQTQGQSDATPQDVRRTRDFTEAILSGGYGTYRLYPVLSKTSYPGTAAMKYGYSAGGTDYPVYPLPIHPIDCVYRVQDTYVKTSITLTKLSGNTIRISLTAQNITNSAQDFNLGFLDYYLWFYPKNSNGDTDYQNSQRLPSPGDYQWGSSVVNIPANSSYTATQNRDVPASTYGAWVTCTMTYRSGWASGCAASVTY